MIKGKTVLVGITGSVAAYKTIDLIRRLRDGGVEVRAIMTDAAKEFITPLSISLACGSPALSGIFEEPFSHIDGPARADLFLVAPATANSIGKFAHGIADDLLSTAFLVYRGPVLLAPAMNWRMYENPVFRNNLQSLLALGAVEIPPQRGSLACGEEGVGKMADIDTILEETRTALTQKDLVGEHVVITAGPTREPIDPVRFLSNRSSGKMGYAIARVARRRGAKVTLITGPVCIPTPAGIDVVRVETAAEMHAAVMEQIETATLAIFAAAVADLSPVAPSSEKAEKADLAALSLAKTPDILASVCALPKRPFTIGFAAETGPRLDRARRKLTAKGADMLVFNDVSAPGAGFETDTNAVTFIFPDNHGGYDEEELPICSKEDVAAAIFDAKVARRG
ncbi:MAG TPA: bifunctional phosphopantothenoylcysteine decarboxylase/phosphopantothenate--cysteine ligase CoaBC [Dissulfurispiraceae bacterium]|nr:bifunctional phosphopantothenoylcysteine decarboxylase/phosphopantothenate--cysteine ligase CoaBC [Dissulfurispiraceae bacterium]